MYSQVSLSILPLCSADLLLTPVMVPMPSGTRHEHILTHPSCPCPLPFPHLPFSGMPPTTSRCRWLIPPSPKCLLDAHTNHLATPLVNTTHSKMSPRCPCCKWPQTDMHACEHTTSLASPHPLPSSPFSFPLTTLLPPLCSSLYPAALAFCPFFLRDATSHLTMPLTNTTLSKMSPRRPILQVASDQHACVLQPGSLWRSQMQSCHYQPQNHHIQVFSPLLIPLPPSLTH